MNGRTPDYSDIESEAYDSRVDLNHILMRHPADTFIFSCRDNPTLGLSANDILIVDRAEIPQPNSLIVTQHGHNFLVGPNKGLLAVWGVVTFHIKKA